jgi:periplasmic protein TonB
MAMKKIILAAAAGFAAMGVTTLPAMAEGPVLVKQVPPEYPRGAERRSLEGTVDLSFVVDADGKVASVEVKGASIPGVFDKAAISALEKWVFEKGQPGEGEVTIAFKLG